MSDLPADLDALVARARERFAKAATEHELRTDRAEVLGKKGDLTAALRSLGQAPADQRRTLGERINAAKGMVEGAFEARLAELHANARRADLEGPPYDLTLPARLAMPRGHLHPITRVKWEILDAFATL